MVIWEQQHGLDPMWMGLRLSVFFGAIGWIEYFSSNLNFDPSKKIQYLADGFENLAQRHRILGDYEGYCRAGRNADRLRSVPRETFKSNRIKLERV